MARGSWWRSMDGAECWLPRGVQPAWDGEEGAPVDITALVKVGADGPTLAEDGWCEWRPGPELGGGAWYTTPTGRFHETRPPRQGPVRTISFQPVEGLRWSEPLELGDALELVREAGWCWRCAPAERLPHHVDVCAGGWLAGSQPITPDARCAAPRAVGRIDPGACRE